MNENKKSYRDYLDKTFLEELNYKIWFTKGTRFNANRRLLHIANLSNISTSMLSVYLIAIGLLSVYNIYSPRDLNNNIIAYSITSLSILLLVFVQIENAKDYKTKAKQFHNCGLELSNLYNQLRIFKTLKEDKTIKDKEQFANKIADEYQRILEKHDNHADIDHKIFKTQTVEYHQLDFLSICRIKSEYYIKTSFIYHLLIIVPPIIIIGLLYFSTNN